MAWRPSEWVTDGEIDNTTLGWTVGWVKIQGRDDPLRLKLAGNCHPDLAGWKFKIVRTDPIPDWAEPLILLDQIATDQSGHVGDVTADQDIKHIECSAKDFVHRTRAGEDVPTVWRKALYLEWYSNANGRCVIQSTRLAVERIGQQQFELTKEQWAEQAKQNWEELNHFMFQVSDVLESQDKNAE
ncbi:hypothetical protein N9Y42_08090 [Mariniblastus sp.]|nr:hypothetical protein [Mariniblastus sp.]